MPTGLIALRDCARLWPTGSLPPDWAAASGEKNVTVVVSQRKPKCGLGVTGFGARAGTFTCM